MYRTLLFAGAVLGAAWASTSEAAPGISWSLEISGPRHDGHEVQFTVESRWSPGNDSSWSNTHDAGELGLSPSQVMGRRQPVRFTFAREAGRLDCGGTLGAGSGAGLCSFTPDPAYATFLESRRIGRPDEHQSFSLTMSGVGRDLVDALDKGGFERPTIGQLTEMGIQGASAPYVRDIAAAGYHLAPNELVDFLIQGVSSEYVRELASIGPALQHISPADLVSLRIHGVEAAYVRDMAAIGPEFRNLTADDLVAFAIHGVRPALVRAYVRANLRPLVPNDVVAMAIHGVTPEFIDALAALGYRDMTASELVELSIHGVTADYVRSLQRAGMPPMKADQLIRLRLAGFEGRSN